jgi:hypothetical protein
MKITRSFRLTLESVDLLQKAAKETGVPQGDLLEACILDCLPEVRERLSAKVKEEQERREVALARLNANKRGPGRPRKVTRTTETPTERVLSKRQQS